MWDCLCTCHSHQDHHHNIITWRQLLETSGSNLWNIRRCLLSTSHDDDDNEDRCFETSLPSGYSSSSQARTTTTTTTTTTVCVLSSILDFEYLETNHGLDKMPITTSPHQGLPLTKCTGPEWERQRKLVQLQAFSNIVQLSLQAVDKVSWEIINSNKTNNKIKIDLKQKVLETSLQWLLLLFRGKEDIVLGDAILSHWRSIRSRSKKTAKIQKTYKSLVDKIIFDENNNDGLFQELYKAMKEEPSKEKGVVKVNAVYAMIAAFDAVQSLVFWTLWNLSKMDNENWEHCRNLTEQQQQVDIKRLKEFKQQSTRNEPVDLSQASLLARALVETVRVYPPIWTLPRQYSKNNNNKSDVTIVKLDVLSANKASDRKWDPSTYSTLDSAPPCASFGVGKRHCPAGTAALLASYELLRKFIQTFRYPRECKPDHAVASVYLGPTLCTQGRQFFYVEYYPTD